MRRALAAILFVACGTTAPPAHEPVQITDCVAAPGCRERLVVAHSANVLFAPGNSPAAYDASLAQGAHLLETDIRITRDGVPVLLHDDELDFPFGDCEGLVSGTDWADVARCTFKVDRTGVALYDPDTLPPQHPLRLEDLVLRADGRALVVAEIKSDPTNAAARLVLERGWVDRVLFLASDDEAARLRELSPDFWIVLRTRSAADVDAAIAANDPRIVVFHGDEDWTTGDVIARAHAAGRKVWINTFSNAGRALRELEGSEECSAFWARGFDLVQTNRADLCVPTAEAP